jgi:hypothetical protein
MAYNDILSAALQVAAQGFSVFPCQYRTKRPATFNGFKNATTNPATLRRWFGSATPYNVAVATGLTSRCFVLDVDNDDSFQQLIARHGELPLTRQSRSSRGVHHWFRLNAPLQGNNDGRVGHKLDIKADGGYIMAPPSVHESGALYAWLNDAPLAPAPDWLLTLSRTPPKRPARTVVPSVGHNRPPSADNDAYGQAALSYEIDALAGCAEGNRNHALNAASFSLHQLVAGGELNGAEVERRLIEAAHANGLWTDRNDGPVQTMNTIRSGARAGMLQPRSRYGRL